MWASPECFKSAARGGNDRIPFRGLCILSRLARRACPTVLVSGSSALALHGLVGVSVLG